MSLCAAEWKKEEIRSNAGRRVGVLREGRKVARAVVVVAPVSYTHLLESGVYPTRYEIKEPSLHEIFLDRVGGTEEDAKR